MEQEFQPIAMDIGARIRVLENKYHTVNEHLLVINQNMIEEYKGLVSEIRVMNEEMKILKQDLFALKEAIMKMVKEMEIFARKDELKVLEKYINLWNPVDFVTENEFDKKLEEKLKKGSKKSGRRKTR